MTYNVFSGTLNPTQSINPTHCVCPRKDGQAKLSWMAGYVAR